MLRTHYHTNILHTCITLTAQVWVYSVVASGTFSSAVIHAQVPKPVLMLVLTHRFAAPEVPQLPTSLLRYTGRCLRRLCFIWFGFVILTLMSIFFFTSFCANFCTVGKFNVFRIFRIFRPFDRNQQLNTLLHPSPCFPASAGSDESADTSSRSSAPTVSPPARGKSAADNCVAEVSLRSGGRVTVHGDSICAELMSRGSVLFWRCRILKNGPTHSHVCNSWHGLLTGWLRARLVVCYLVVFKCCGCG